MDGAGIHETLERVLLKRDGLRRLLLSLVEGTPLENCLTRNEKAGHECKATHTVVIATPQYLANMKLSKELLSLGIQPFFNLSTLYNFYAT